ALRELSPDVVGQFTARELLMVKILHDLVEVVEIEIFVYWDLLQARFNCAQITAVTVIDHEVPRDCRMRTQRNWAQHPSLPGKNPLPNGRGHFRDTFPTK